MTDSVLDRHEGEVAKTEDDPACTAASRDTRTARERHARDKRGAPVGGVAKTAAAIFRIAHESEATSQYHMPSACREVASSGLSSDAFRKCCFTSNDFSMVARVPSYEDVWLMAMAYHLCTAQCEGSRSSADETIASPS